MRDSQQRQSSGDDSTNLQAGRDVVVNVGATVAEVREIALDVFKANFLQLSETAAELAFARVEKFNADFLSVWQTRAPDTLSSVRDPDMQRSIFNAQQEYACSGEEDLEQVLVDLLVDRAGQSERDIVTLTLNESIIVVPKLTADQRAAIAISFMVRHTGYRAPTLAEFYKMLADNWVPVSFNLPTKQSAYQHLQYVGAATVSTIEHVTVENAALQQSRPFFTRGFERQAVSEPLTEHIEDSRLFITCYRDPAALQVTCKSQQEITELTPHLMSLGSEAAVQEYQRLYDVGVMTEPEIRADIVEHIPALNGLFNIWNGSSLTGMALTSVGLAIGHAYWRRVNSDLPGLSIWL